MIFSVHCPYAMYILGLQPCNRLEFIMNLNPCRYEFFNDLYHRFLLTPKTHMKCMCLQAMAIVYGKCHDEIGGFNDTKYIVGMLERVSKTTLISISIFYALAQKFSPISISFYYALAQKFSPISMYCTML
jgi:hypothetical protein